MRHRNAKPFLNRCRRHMLILVAKVITSIFLHLFWHPSCHRITYVYLYRKTGGKIASHSFRFNVAKSWLLSPFVFILFTKKSLKPTLKQELVPTWLKSTCIICLHTNVEYFLGKKLHRIIKGHFCICLKKKKTKTTITHLVGKITKQINPCLAIRIVSSFESKDQFLLYSMSMRCEPITLQRNKDFLAHLDLSYQTEEVGFILETTFSFLILLPEEVWKQPQEQYWAVSYFSLWCFFQKWY